jgi:hypothetical protein
MLLQPSIRNARLVSGFEMGLQGSMEKYWKTHHKISVPACCIASPSRVWIVRQDSVSDGCVCHPENCLNENSALFFLLARRSCEGLAGRAGGCGGNAQLFTSALKDSRVLRLCASTTGNFTTLLHS